MARREFDRHGNQCYYSDSVLGARDAEKLAGVFDENFRVPVKAYIDGEDFCNAVRRCLLHDLLAGAMDGNDRKRY